ncbi:hypothetical protein BBJ28_00024048 [Nothophytophthora sp. Chile5]|nr:hypothetical protein BBJ28_00024048 [Nothophytophthora sp. Chile5]
MATYLQEMMNRKDALALDMALPSHAARRCDQGVLKGYDQCVNVILDDSFERVFSLKEPVEAVELGLYIVRGDNMYVMLCGDAFRVSVIGGVPDDIREQVIDDQTRAAPLKPLVH